MSTEPDDFGFNAVATLAHCAADRPPSGFGPFWQKWRDAETTRSITLAPATDDAGVGVTHRIQGQDIAIGTRLIEPPEGIPLVGGVVVGHGYGELTPLGAGYRWWTRLAARGIAVLAIRVRGFPGSPPEADPIGWILEGLASEVDAGNEPDPCSWIVSGAVRDTVNSVRALNNWLRERGVHTPPTLYGISFGGGLAVIAAAQLARLCEDGKPGCAIGRLVLGVPTFGDWHWRTQSQRFSGNGSGALIHDLLVRHRAREEALLLCLSHFDATLHAKGVRCPVLCRLAVKDDVVPAPTAAAVFNALSTDTGHKWRYVTSFGHYDGGLTHARRYELFDRMACEFMDPTIKPETTMNRWADVVAGSMEPPSDEHGASGSQERLFADDGTWTDADDTRLLAAYETAGRTLDDLPYTPEFEKLLAASDAASKGRSPRDVLARLLNLRKAGNLPKLGRAGSSPVRVDPEEEARLGELVAECAGAMGSRDRLPYTEAFDTLVERFNAETGRSLSPHELWRLVARLAK
ncbi:MAG: acetylxylan esterase [Planctomycetota bacterium]